MIGDTQFVLALFFLAGVGGVALATWLARRVWVKRADMPWPKKLLASLVAAAGMYGALQTLLGVFKAFGAITGQSEDPALKASMLAEGISQAINCFAFSLMIWVPSALVAFVIARLTKHRPR